jgi:hypothetical protein
MSDYVSNPLLALIKERNLIDDLQLEEVIQEITRSGKPVIQILQTFSCWTSTRSSKSSPSTWEPRS